MGDSNPLMGMALNRRPIKIWSTMATQKLGAEMPTTARVMRVRSTALPRFRAETIPKVRPTARAMT